MDITAILLSAVIVMFALSGPRGKNRYYPLGYALFLTLLASSYAFLNHEALFYGLAVVALLKGVYSYLRWQG